MPGLFDSFEKLINEHGSATILKERLLLVADQYAALEKALAASEAKAKEVIAQKEHLELENLQTKEEVQALKDRLAHFASLSEFTEEAGALFRRHKNGEWDYTPYCPSCKTAMVAPSRHELYRCGKKSCGQFASFDGLHVGDVVSRVDQRGT